MKVVGYIRVSTEKQASQGVSIEAQKQALHNYCEYKKINLVKIIEDAGISGSKNKKRDGFVELLNLVGKDGIDIILVYSFSRLSREMITLLAFEKLLNDYNVQFHTIQGAIDTSTATGWGSFAFQCIHAEMERRQVQERTKHVLGYKKSKGEVVGTIPYGFKRKGNKLVKNIQEQKVIKIVNILYNKKLNLSEICRELAGKGIKTRSGNFFVVQQVKRIIPDYENKQKRKRKSSIFKEFILGVS